MERDPQSGRVEVVSQHVAGIRLTDVLMLAREHEIVPELTVGLSLAADLLAAVHALHQVSGHPHGIISSDRAIVTSTGDLVLTDFAFADAVAAARFSARRLWGEFGVAPWPGEPFSVAADIRQSALVGIALMLGRPFAADDLPGRLSALLREVEEAATIRGGRLFAEPVMGWVQRSLAAGTAFGFATAEEAATACATLLTDRERGQRTPEFRQFLDDILAPTAPGNRVPRAAVDGWRSDGPGSPGDGSRRAVESVSDMQDLENPREPLDAPPLVEAPVGAASVAAPPGARSIARSVTAAPAAAPNGAVASPPPLTAGATALDGRASTSPLPVVGPPPAPGIPGIGSLVDSRSPFAVLDEAPRASSQPRPLEPAQHRTPPRLTPSPYEPPPSIVVPASAPLDRSPAAVTGVAPAISPNPAAPASEPAIRLKEEARPARSSLGIYEPLHQSVFEETADLASEGGWLPFARRYWKPGAAAAIALAIGISLLLWPSGAEVPAAAVAMKTGVLVVETEPPGSELSVNGEARGLTPVTLEIEAGRHDLRLSRDGVEHAWNVEVAAGARKVERLNWAALRPVGGIEVISNAAGARVLLNGKPVGETPLTLGDLEPGRYTLVIQAPTGMLRRTVTVVAGETAKVDAAIYSGWVLVSAPIELQVLENGRSIAVAGEGPILLPAGRHTLELVNDALAYRATHEVDIKPGEEERLAVAPTGTVNINALPWADVWIDGANKGETPLANLVVPLGTREIVLRHPEHGERKVPVVVKAGPPLQVAVDFSRPQ